MYWLRKNSQIVTIVLLLLLSIPAIISLLRPGFFVSDDGEWMVIRFSAFYYALKDGQFPVRFLPTLNHGYGYPVANFLYPGFMYLGVPIHILGFGFVETIKIIFGVSLVGSSIFAYLWLKHLFSKSAAFVGGLFYLYAPYHLYDVYTRGSVGEALALAVVPFVLWQIERKSFFWISLGTGFLILSHNTLALLFFPLLILYALIRLKHKKNNSLISIFLPFILGIGMATFFWLPALYDLQYTVFAKTSVAEWAAYFPQAPLIGVLTIVIMLVALTILVQNKKDSKQNTVSWFFLVVSFISLLLVLPISSFLWQIMPISFIQFPFRLLSIIILTCAFLLGLIIDRFKKNSLVVILCIFILFQGFFYISPSAFTQKEEGFYTTNQDTTTVKNEYMPKWVEVLPTENPKDKIEVSAGKVSNIITRSNLIGFVYNNTQKSTSAKARINMVYFPGWNVYINGREVAMVIDENGRITFPISTLSSAVQTVEIKFQETTVRIISDMISVASIIIVIVFGLRGVGGLTFKNK